jgi:hypothetical protein
MFNARIAIISLTAVTGCALAGVAGAAQVYDKTFLSDYTRLVATPLPNNAGTDLLWVDPSVDATASKYTSVMVDEPEVLMSATSPYNGAKPTDLEAIAGNLRKDVSDALKAGGYAVVDAPGPNVLYVRLAVTDLSLERKKRRLLAYTPIGFVVKLGADSLRDMMQKYDIMGAAIQAQLSDSATQSLLSELVALRGDNGKRMDFSTLDSEVTGFASRLRCRLDNSHVAAGQKINCLDAAARKAREAAGPVVK